MKLSELKYIVDTLSKGSAIDPEVVIAVSERSMPARASVSVTSAHQGFDWNHGRFFLEPAEPVIRKVKK